PVCSYNGSVPCGIIAARALVPDLDDLAKHLERSASDFQAAAVKRPRAHRSASRATKQPAQKPIDLGIADQTVVAAPNGDRGDVRTDAAAEVDDVVGPRVDGGRRHRRRLG